MNKNSAKSYLRHPLTFKSCCWHTYVHRSRVYILINCSYFTYLHKYFIIRVWICKRTFRTTARLLEVILNPYTACKHFVHSAHISSDTALCMYVVYTAYKLTSIAGWKRHAIEALSQAKPRGVWLRNKHNYMRKFVGCTVLALWKNHDMSMKLYATYEQNYKLLCFWPLLK